MNVLASADAYRQVRDRLTAVRSLVKGMLEAPVNMKTRIILVEEDSIRTLEEKRLTGVWSVAEQQALDKHRAKWNETVGVVEEAKRESILTDLMIVLAGQADYRHTMADYQKAREEWEKVRLVIQSRRDALSPSASSKVPLVRQVISPAVKSMEEIKTLDPQALTKSIAKDSGGNKASPVCHCRRERGERMKFLPVLIMFIMWGCSTDLKVKPYVPGANGSIDGIPFRVPAAHTIRIYKMNEGTGRYELVHRKTATLPATDQLYTLNYSASFLANPNFELTFATDNTLKSILVEGESNADKILSSVATQSVATANAITDFENTKRAAQSEHYFSERPDGSTNRRAYEPT